MKAAAAEAAAAVVEGSPSRALVAMFAVAGWWEESPGNALRRVELIERLEELDGWDYTALPAPPALPGLLEVGFCDGSQLFIGWEMTRGAYQPFLRVVSADLD